MASPPAGPTSTLPQGPPAAGVLAERLVGALRQVVRGQEDVVELVVCAFLAGGHVLLEGVPGVGKTVLARALATAAGGSFRRVQATADLLPTEITGSSVFRADGDEFRFVPGPLFANVVLVDEINRAMPRTQSALFEAMAEGRVTVDGRTHALPDPLCIVATQNPLEHHGTYPLPEGQLDRFTMAVTVDHVDERTERDIVRAHLQGEPIDQLAPVANPDDLRRARAHVELIHVSEPVLAYAVALARATRTAEGVALGASTRGTLALVRCAQARAIVHGRGHVLPDDVKALARPVLAHRVHAAGGDSGAVVEDLIERLPAPRALTPAPDRRRPPAG